MEKVVNMNGIVEEKAIKETKKGEEYAEFKIESDGKINTWRWFYAADDKGKETAKSIKKGDFVEGIGELNEGTYNDKPITYRNIKELHKSETPVEEVKAYAPKPYDTTGVEFGLAAHLAIDTIAILQINPDNLEAFEKAYSNWLGFFYRKNKELRELANQNKLTYQEYKNYTEFKQASGDANAK